MSTSANADDALVAAVTELGRTLITAAGDDGLDIDTLVAVAARAIPRADHAALTLVRGNRPPETTASTGELPYEVDRIQYETGEGPCLEAIENDEIARVDDLATDQQWPKFAALAVERTPVRSMCGVRLRIPGNQRAALNFYATRPHAFTELDVGIAAILSTYVALAMERDGAKRSAENLEKALQSSRQIGAAMGVLMARHLMTPEAAFAQLKTASQHLQRKLRDVALHVLDTGELPDR